MTTRSNLHYSVDAESLQRAINDALPGRPPLQTPVSTSRPQLQPAIPANATTTIRSQDLELITPLEQNFILLKKCTKKAFLIWKPTYVLYKNQGGSRTLPYCMETDVQLTFLQSLPQFENLTITDFLATSTLDLLSYISDLFKMSKIINWRSLLTALYMTVSANFDRDMIEIYIQKVSVLLTQYPTMFDTDLGGTTQKTFTKAFLEGLYPTSFRKVVLDKDAANFRAVLKAIHIEFDNFDIYMDILSLNTSSTTTSSSSHEGKVADVAISISPTANHLCNNCNLKRHAKARYCKLLCRLCPGLAPHKYYEPNICRQFFTMKAQKQRAGTWNESKLALNANIVQPPSITREDLDNIAALKDMLKQVSNKKRLLLDSGCNTNIISSTNHSDIPIIYRESKDGISTANGQVIPILGQGSVLDTPADFVPSFVDSLLSVSQICKLKDSCFIFSKTNAINISLTSDIKTLLSQINDIAVTQNLILCTATLTNDNLYAVDNTMSNNTLSPLSANATYYQTAQLDSVADVVRYFHESWSHCSLDSMIHILQNNVFTNIPPTLTEKAIRKYFPMCPACTAGNMTRKSYPSETLVHRNLLPGEELIMDIKIIADNKHNVHKKSFNNNLSALTIIDNATDFKWGYPLPNHGTSASIIDKLIIVHQEIISHNRILRYIRADDQFVTSDI